MSVSTREHERDPLEFLQVLWRLNHAMEQRSRHMLATLGVTAPQRMVLRLVGRTPGITAGKLAEQLGVDPGTLSSALRRLEAMGFLERGADPADGRRVLIHLTPRGARLDIDAPLTVEHAVRGVLRQLPAERARATRDVLELLATALAVDAPADGGTWEGDAMRARRGSPRAQR